MQPSGCRLCHIPEPPGVSGYQSGLLTEVIFIPRASFVWRSL